VLEEHGGCEIPAGCGGVILRWYDPAAEVSASVWIVTAAGAEAFLDGRPLHDGRPALSAGRHVIALKAPRPDPGGFVIALTVWGGASSKNVSREVKSHLNVVSVAGPAWRFTTAAPPAGWLEPGFDDRAWSPMIAARCPRPGEGLEPYPIRYVHAHGGEEIGVPVDGPVWVRHEFAVIPGAVR
jgi:hypothetical protein